MRFIFALGVAALTLAEPATAAWHQASSKHFIIYGDMPAEEMEAYAEKLETFDAAARLIRSMKDPEVGDGNRLQVFVTPSMLEVNRLFGGNADSGILGYYVGDVEGPYVVTPRKIRRLGQNLEKRAPENVFFHEYAHHLMLQNTNKPMPAWLTEGFAEFLSEPRFGEDGSIGLGTPVTDRAEEIYKYPWAPLGDLLEGNAETLWYGGFWHQNYAQGWLLNHYLIFSPSRKGQIDAYVKGIESGQNPRDAARAAFGDIGQLEKELVAYRKEKSWPYVKIDATKLEIDPVVVTPMSAGAAEVMLLRMHAKTGYRALNPQTVLKKAREIAVRHPNDPTVLRTLAEVENKVGNFDEAERAADAALKLDPKSTEALILKGRASLGRAAKVKDPAQFTEARRSFMSANRLDPEDPEPLYLYYRTYLDANAAVPKSAVEALSYASVLAPRDTDIAEELVVQYLRDNNLKAASDALKPLAYLPHWGETERNKARKVLEQIEAGRPGDALKIAEKDLLDDDEDD